MKKAIFFLACIYASIFTVSISHAQSTLIHYWHFNSYSLGTMYTPTINPIPADYSDLPTTNPGILYRTLAGTSAAYSSFIEGFTSAPTDNDTVNLRMSQPAGMYIRTRNPSDSMELLFYTPSTHFRNLAFTFGTSRPTNGMTHQNYDYSIDSGATWITTDLSMLTDSVWSTFQRITLTSTNAAIDNNPRLVFRVTWTGNTTGTNGNNRFDNVTLDGDSISTTGLNNSVIGELGSYTLYPNPVLNNLDISTFVDGIKDVIITNAYGQQQFQCKEEKNQFSINTSDLKPGYYFIQIRESSTGTSNTMKFIKL